MFILISMTTTTCALCLHTIQETTNNEWVVKIKVNMQNLRWAIQVYFNIMGTACTFSIKRFICDLFYTTLPAFHRRATVKEWETCPCVCVWVSVCETYQTVCKLALTILRLTLMLANLKIHFKFIMFELKLFGIGICMLKNLCKHLCIHHQTLYLTLLS